MNRGFLGDADLRVKLDAADALARGDEKVRRRAILCSGMDRSKMVPVRIVKSNRQALQR